MTTGLVSTRGHRLPGDRTCSAWPPALGLLLALGCSSSTSTPPPGPALAPDAVRFLEQSTFGPTEALVASVQDAGFTSFLDAQFATPPSSLGTYPVVLQPSAVVCPPSAPSNCYRDNFTAFQPAVQFFHNALVGNDQLRQRVGFALSQIFVVSDEEVNSTYGMADYEQLLLADAFGNVRQLLQDVTLSPAMGRYLNMVNNDKANATAGTHPNENYARELLQLFSIGLVKLNADGTVVTDATGQPVPTYDQSVVDGFAAVFTGWTYPTVAGATQKTHNPTNYRGVMEAVQSNHDVTAKTLLDGATLPANQTAAQDLGGALDLLFAHPNLGPFLGKQLIQFLVTSNPSPAYVGRVSAAFANNGAGVRGDMMAVVQAILLDSEARGVVQPGASYGKLREPAVLAANLARALGVQSDGVYLRNASSSMEQPVYEAGSVFNFYPPNYPLPGTTLVSPPSTLLDSASVLVRSNFVYGLLFTTIAPDPTIPGATGTSAALTSFFTSTGDAGALADRLNALLMHGTMSAGVRQAVVNAVNAVPSSDPIDRVRAAAYVVGTSAQYQVEQ
jgi:uncharacterized protein (DUF1800 family)